MCAPNSQISGRPKARAKARLAARKSGSADCVAKAQGAKERRLTARMQINGTVASWQKNLFYEIRDHRRCARYSASPGKARFKFAPSSGDTRDEAESRAHSRRAAESPDPFRSPGSKALAKRIIAAGPSNSSP